MAIKYVPEGYGELVTSTAQQAGEAIAARRAAELAQELEFRREQADLQLQQRREELLMSQEFSKQMKQLDMNMELEKVARSKMWEIEKMETVSRLDFEKEEKERQQFQAELDQVKRDGPNGSGKLNEQEYRQVQAQIYAKYGKEGVAAQLSRPVTKDEAEAQLLLKSGIKEPVVGAKPAGPTTPISVGQQTVVDIGAGPQIFNMETGKTSDIESTKEYAVVINGQSRKVTGSNLFDIDPKTGKPWVELVQDIHEWQAPVNQVEIAKAFSTKRFIASLTPIGAVASLAFPNVSSTDQSLLKADKVLKDLENQKGQIKSSVFMDAFVTNLLNLKIENPNQSKLVTSLLKRAHKLTGVVE